MEGTHPFAGMFQGGGDPPPYEDRIVSGHFAYGTRRVPYHPMPVAPALDILPPALRQLFVRCFDDGHFVPAARRMPRLAKRAASGRKGTVCLPGQWTASLFKSSLRLPLVRAGETVGGSSPVSLTAGAGYPPAPPLFVCVAVGGRSSVSGSPASRSSSSGSSVPLPPAGVVPAWAVHTPLAASVNGGIPGAIPISPAPFPVPGNSWAWARWPGR